MEPQPAPAADGQRVDDVAAEAGMYRAVPDRACTRLAETVGTGGDDAAIAILLRAASAGLDAFRLLFRHAAREPEFATRPTP